jgi:type 1 glutamine amidotransferase
MIKRLAFIIFIVLTLGFCLIAWAQPKRLLVIDTANDYHHRVIPVAEKVIKKLAKQSGQFSVDIVSTNIELKDKLSSQGLAHYDAVMFLNTTGELPIPDMAAFLQWIKAGHGFIAIHSAADTLHKQPEYFDMLGGEFQEHFDQVPATVLVADNQFPATKMFGKEVNISKEEFPLYKNYSPQNHLLLYLDHHPNRRLPGFYPISWCRNYGQGRVFFSAIGHRADTWKSHLYQESILGAMEWGLGLAPGDCSAAPNPPAKQQPDNAALGSQTASTKSD